MMSEIWDAPLHKATRQARSQASLAGLVAAAEAVLTRDGAADFSIAGVAAEAGVSVGGVYRRFQDKQQLLRAVKDRVLRRLELAIEKGLTSFPTPDLHSAVETFVEVLFSTFEGGERLFLAIMDSAGDELLAQRGREGLTLTLDTLKTALLRHSDEITHPDPAIAAAMVFYMVLGTGVRRMQGQAQPFQLLSWPVLKRQMTRACLAYLKAAPGI